MEYEPVLQNSQSHPNKGPDRFRQSKQVDSMTKSTIGFIGLGLMGHGMAKNIREAVARMKTYLADTAT